MEIPYRYLLFLDNSPDRYGDHYAHCVRSSGAIDYNYDDYVYDSYGSISPSNDNFALRSPTTPAATVRGMCTRMVT